MLKTTFSPFTYIVLAFSDEKTKSHPELGLTIDALKKKFVVIGCRNTFSRCLQKPTSGWFSLRQPDK